MFTEAVGRAIIQDTGKVTKALIKITCKISGKE